ncbi:MAG: hypothetical protein EPO42_13340 [Gallionellaceae bacterium]|nr:MAG: hypothetical protein EPO42_13340 [Gallionellaceae bacterium]
MKTTADYIDALRVKFNVDSDFKAMNRLGVNHRQQVSQWRKLHGAFGEELSIKVADALEIDRAEVLLAMQAQKESNQEIRKLWERIATLAIGVTAALSVFAVLPIEYFPNGAQYGLIALSTSASGNFAHYVKYLFGLLAFPRPVRRLTGAIVTPKFKTAV